MNVLKGLLPRNMLNAAEGPVWAAFEIATGTITTPCETVANQY